MEAKLYSRLRFGFSPDREKIILDSKTSHGALAKLNWMDKQIANHLDKQEEEKETEERQLHLLQEQRKHEDHLEKYRDIRDSEIKELRLTQENHIHELKSREMESNCLKAEELHLRKRKEEIEHEYQRLRDNAMRRKEHAVKFYNIRRIKMLFRKRSEEIIRNITEDIEMLQRITQCLTQNDKTNYIRNMMKEQLNVERENNILIDAMYDSEAKNELVRAESKWQTDSDEREHLMRSLMVNLIDEIENQLTVCIGREKKVLDDKESHLQIIEDTNERLKNLVGENDRDLINIPMETLTISEKERDSREKHENDRKINYSSELGPPRFGRKKIAWN